jgi:hypothetical protein
MDEKAIMKKFGVTKEEYMQELAKAKKMVENYYNYKLLGRLVVTGYFIIMAYYHIHFGKIVFLPPEFLQFLIIILLIGVLDMIRFYFFFPKKHPLRFYLYVQERKKSVNFRQHKKNTAFLISFALVVAIINFFIVLAEGLPIVSADMLRSVGLLLIVVILVADYFLFKKAGFREDAEQASYTKRRAGDRIR